MRYRGMTSLSVWRTRESRPGHSGRGDRNGSRQGRPADARTHHRRSAALAGARGGRGRSRLRDPPRAHPSRARVPTVARRRAARPRARPRHTLGCYLHGAFGSDRLRTAWLRSLGLPPGAEGGRGAVDSDLDHLLRGRSAAPARRQSPRRLALVASRNCGSRAALRQPVAGRGVLEHGVGDGHEAENVAELILGRQRHLISFWSRGAGRALLTGHRPHGRGTTDGARGAGCPRPDIRPSSTRAPVSMFRMP